MRQKLFYLFPTFSCSYFSIFPFPCVYSPTNATARVSVIKLQATNIYSESYIASTHQQVIVFIPFVLRKILQTVRFGAQQTNTFRRLKVLGLPQAFEGSAGWYRLWWLCDNSDLHISMHTAHVICLHKGDAIESISKIWKRKSISRNSTHSQVLKSYSVSPLWRLMIRTSTFHCNFILFAFAYMTAYFKLHYCASLLFLCDHEWQTILLVPGKAYASKFSFIRQILVPLSLRQTSHACCNMQTCCTTLGTFAIMSA